MKKLPDDIRKLIREKYAPQVRTSCDEYHAHRWDADCFTSSNPEALLICRLLDYAESLERRAEQVKVMLTDE